MMSIPWTLFTALVLTAATLATGPAFAAAPPLAWIDPEADAWQIEAIAPAEFPESPDEFAQWRLRAATKRDAEAAFSLAHTYATRTAGASPADVRQWATIGADAGSREAAYLLARYFATRQPPDRKSALANLLRAAKAGLPEALFALGTWMPQNAEESATVGDRSSWLKRAADAGSAPAQLALGKALALRGNHAAEAWLRRAAEQSFPPAAAALGEWYASATPPRWTTAAEWYQLAAEAGHAGATARLAELFEYGRGVPRDPHRASALYVDAAVDPPTRAQLAIRLLLGQGLPRDPDTALRLVSMPPDPPPPLCLALGKAWASLPESAESTSEAARWLSIAVYAGEREAPALLQACLQRWPAALAAQAREAMAASYRRGVPDAPAEKLAWTTRAAELGLPEAAYDLGDIYERQPDVAPHDQTRAMDWYRRSAAMGYARAIKRVADWEDYQQSKKPIDIEALERAAQQDPTKLARIAEYYDAPSATRQRDVSRAITWYRRAAMAGDRLAYFRLAYLLESDPAGPRDPAEALKWYRLDAEAGHLWAAEIIGEHYLSGQGVPRDTTQAIRWFEQAAAAGSLSAFRTLANLYDGPLIGPPKPEKALFWWRAGAESLDPYAMRRLGELSETGRLVPASLPEAYKWYRLAVELRSTKAPARLERLVAQMTPAQLEEGRQRLAGWVLGHEDDFQLRELREAAYPALGLKPPTPQNQARESQEDRLHRLQVLAAHGVGWAMRGLAKTYREGGIAPANPSLAERWLIKAAETGDTGAMLELSEAYRSGAPFAKDDPAAMAWWLVAQAHWRSPTGTYSGIQQMTPEQRATAQKRAEAWLQLHPPLPPGQGSISD